MAFKDVKGVWQGLSTCLQSCHGFRS